jgi:hypothetical protein
MQMQAGQLDRTQLTAAYSAQLMDEAVRRMTRYVNLYGASPTSAEIPQSRTIADQTFLPGEIHLPARRRGQSSDRVRWPRQDHRHQFYEYGRGLTDGGVMSRDEPSTLARPFGAPAPEAQA